MKSTVEVKNNGIINTATPKPKRKGWEKAFKEMAKNGDDALAFPDAFIEENAETGSTMKKNNY